MKKFKLYLKEGGNAVDNVSRINQENVSDTLKSLYRVLLPKLKLTKKSISVLGTTGKKRPGESSGDIDIAISASDLMKKTRRKTTNQLYDYMLQVARQLSTSVKDSRGLGTISFSFPIINKDGKQNGQNVQIDLFLVNSLEYATWIFYGPSHVESELKGVYRNIALAMVAKHAQLKITKQAGGETVEQERLLFSFTKGLMKSVQSREGKRGINKNFKTIQSTLIAEKPEEIVRLLFGEKFQPSDLMTFEKVIKAITSNKFIHKKHRKEILQALEKALLNQGLPIPEVLRRVL